VRKIILSLLSITIAASIFAQNNSPVSKREARQQKKLDRKERINDLIRQDEEGEIIYNKQSAFMLKLLTDGYAIGYEFGKFQSNRKSLLFQFELAEKKHQKEKREGYFDPEQVRVNYLVFGKMNTFYQIKLGVAKQQVIGGKGNKNGVSVSGTYGAGLTIGLVKPYMLDVEDNFGNVFESKYPEIQDSSYNVIKAKGISGGWSKLKVRPGLYARTGLRFDYGRMNETVAAIEVGLAGEFYSSKVPQMLYSKDKQFFFSGYVAILLGKRK
jgi:hypothetical protein